VNEVEIVLTYAYLQRVCSHLWVHVYDSNRIASDDVDAYCFMIDHTTTFVSGMIRESPGLFSKIYNANCHFYSEK